MEIKNIENESKKKMEEAIHAFSKELINIRTGKANPSIFDGIHVVSYGTTVKLNQIANIILVDARLIEIRPWDPNSIKDIEKSILESNLGFTPSNDGKVIRVSIPALNEDSRKNLIKVVKNIEEKYKVSVRNIRRDAIEILKSANKNKELPEDILYKEEGKIQEITDLYIKKVEEITARKEEEILEI